MRPSLKDFFIAFKNDTKIRNQITLHLPVFAYVKQLIYILLTTTFGFTLVGFSVGRLNNFIYFFVSVTLIIIISFTLVRLKWEYDIKEKSKANYSIKSIVYMDILKLMTILFLSQGIILLLFYVRYTGYLLIIITLMIAVISTLALIVFNHFSQDMNGLFINVLYTTIFIIIFNIGFIYLIPIGHVMIHYLIMTFLTISFYALKELFKYQIYNIKDIFPALYIILIIMALMVFYTSFRTIDYDLENPTPAILSIPYQNDNLPYNSFDEPVIYDINTTHGTFYIDIQNRLYNANGHYLSTLPSSTFYSYNNELYIITDLGLNDEGREIYELSVIDADGNATPLFTSRGNSNTRYVLINDQWYRVSGGYQGSLRSVENPSEISASYDIDNDLPQIITISPDIFVYYDGFFFNCFSPTELQRFYGERFTYYMYHNGHILVIDESEGLSKLSVYTITDFVNHSDPLFIINNLYLDLQYIEKFQYQDNLFYLKTSNKEQIEILILDENGSVNQDVIFRKSIINSQSIGSLYELNDGIQISYAGIDYYASYDHISTPFIYGEGLFVDEIVLMLIMLIIFLFPINLVWYKRGDQ